jgi:hypothetical protein
LLVFLLSAVNVMNTAFCSIIWLCDKPRGLNQSCRLELSGTTFLLNHCVIHKSLAFFFSFLFLFYYIFLLLFLLYVFLCRLPPFLFCVSCLFPLVSFVFSFCLSLSRFSFLPISLFLSFFQPVFSMFPFCLALFLAVFLSA